MRSTFKLLFYINRLKIKRNGRCPIMGRVTLDGKISQYSTGLEIEPDLWDAKVGKAFTDGRKTGNITGEKRNELNRLNSLLEALEEKAEIRLQKKTWTLMASSRRKSSRMQSPGNPMSKRHCCPCLTNITGEYAKRVGVDRTRHSYVRYLTTRKHIYNFLRYKYDLEDIPLRSLTMKFMTDFTFYFSTVLRLKVSAYNDYLILLHKMTRLALKKHILKRDPFAGHKVEKVPVNHRHLTGEQFEKLLNARLPDLPPVPYTRPVCLFGVHGHRQGRSGKPDGRQHHHEGGRFQMDPHRAAEDQGGVPYQTS